jgi:hypothetical protein
MITSTLVLVKDTYYSKVKIENYVVNSYEILKVLFFMQNLPILYP